MALLHPVNGTVFKKLTPSYCEENTFVFILTDSLHITFSTKAPSFRVKSYQGLTMCVLSVYKIPWGLEKLCHNKRIYRTLQCQTDPYMMKSQRRLCLNFASKNLVTVYPSSWIGFLTNPLCIPWTEEFGGSLSHMGRLVGRKQGAEERGKGGEKRKLIGIRLNMNDLTFVYQMIKCLPFH